VNDAELLNEGMKRVWDKEKLDKMSKEIDAKSQYMAVVPKPITVRLDVRTRNYANGSQGRTRAGMLARAAEKKTLRAQASNGCHYQTRASLTFMYLLHLMNAGGCAITLTRIAPRELDAHDGLRSALKPVVDGVADFFGCKDNDPRLSWQYEQRRGRVREYAVEIRLEAR
jgi:hypothetical protein